MKIKPVYAIAAVVAVGLLTTASSCSVDEQGSTVDQSITEDLMSDFSRSQPIPVFKYSQERQNVIDILTARANATPTTSFFFNQGVKDPVFSCPSIGYAIPHTTQLTSPDQVVDRYEGDVVIAQAEPVGDYTGDSTGTHVICRDANGRGFDMYWEGFVGTVSGPAEWDGSNIALIGAPTGDFSTGK